MNGFEAIVDMFCSPEFKEMAANLEKAGTALKKYRQAMGNLQEDMYLLGFPAFSHPGGVGVAPFDTLSSFLRGMEGSMLDMYRQPENVIKACETILARRKAVAMPADPNTRGNPKRVFMPLWRGDKSFMSQKHFETFYWPTLKGALLACIELGYVPVPVYEAHYGERLECMLELPKGKAVASVEHMDVLQVKEILGGHTCIIGNVPKSLRYTTPKEALAYYKNLIEKVKEGGGIMLNIALPHNATLDEKKEMVKTIKEYATY
jgi:uroporphyrinogen-III decarboxylase